MPPPEPLPATVGHVPWLLVALPGGRKKRDVDRSATVGACGGGAEVAHAARRLRTGHVALHAARGRHTKRQGLPVTSAAAGALRSLAA